MFPKKSSHVQEHISGRWVGHSQLQTSRFFLKNRRILGWDGAMTTHDSYFWVSCLVWPMEVTYGGSCRWFTMLPHLCKTSFSMFKAPKHLNTTFFPWKSTGSWNFRTAARMNDFNRWNRLSWNSSKLSKQMGTPCAACWIAASRGCDLPSFAEVMLIPVRTWSHAWVCLKKNTIEGKSICLLVVFFERGDFVEIHASKENRLSNPRP